MTRLQDMRLGVYEKAIPLQLSWAEKFRVAKDAGFDFIELSIDGVAPRVHRLEWTKAELDEIRRAAEDSDMMFGTMALTANRFFPLGDADDTVRETGKAIVRRAIDIAAYLGIRVIQVAPYVSNGGLTTSEGVIRFKSSLKEVVGYAAEKGVMLTLEVMPDVPMIKTVKAARELIDEFDTPFLQIYTDGGNMASEGLDPVEDLCYGKNHLLACHVKDGVLGCCRNVPFGTGLVDFDRYFDEFIAIDYHGFFVAELWSNEDEGTIPYLTEVASFIRAKIKAADDRAARQPGG